MLLRDINSNLGKKKKKHLFLKLNIRITDGSEKQILTWEEGPRKDFKQKGQIINLGKKMFETYIYKGLVFLIWKEFQKTRQ